MIIATAGHVDHGKTKLVEALSGIDTDRLPEEKQRGLTIDLGFAYVPQPGGGVLGFVDVPGHEKFIRNMVAGVTAIDFALVVVAADDGPMPQTREHLAILDLLGVRHGAVAITKADAVGGARIKEVEIAVRELLHGSGLAAAQMFALSAQTGAGVAALKAHLEQAAADLSAMPPSGNFRLAIDRVFSLTGAGLVVTGSVHSGQAALGDRLLLSPSGAEVRVRTIHVHDQKAEHARQGVRAAFNLAGPGARKSAIRRGDWLVHPDAHATSRRIDARIRVLPGEVKALKHETNAHLHLGALEAPCRIAILEGREIAPGESALVQIISERPITVHARDRLILRDQSARRTVAGGQVIDPFGPERGRARETRLAILQAMSGATPAAVLAALLPLSPGGLDLARFQLATNLSTAESATLFAEADMVMAGNATSLAGMAPDHWERLRAGIVAGLAEWHETNPETLGPNEFELRRGFAERPLSQLFNAAILELIERGDVRRAGTILHLPAHKAELAAVDHDLWRRIEPLMQAGELRPPVLWEIAPVLKIEVEKVERVLKRAAALGLAVQVTKNRFFLPAAVNRLAEIAEELAGESEDGLFLAAAYRDRSGIGRNLTIELLEYFDRTGLTQRHGPARRILGSAAALFGRFGKKD
ncbi:MAG: selenocysteine-specific translation elongation factor [Rhodospirillaceae bacterium]|nr:selenocysteine-specific translation elongation factor [Rhodospirillaceae bacterium]